MSEKHHHTSRLLLFEGIPGSGKTTTAQFTGRWLEQHGHPARLFLEGDLDHPADYESVAYLDAAAQAYLAARFPERWNFIRSNALQHGHDLLVRYQKLRNEHGDSVLPDPLFQELAGREIYNGQGLETFSRLAMDYWEQFTARASQETDIYIFECCFLQNPITNMLGRHNSPVELIKEYLAWTARIIGPLHPALIYLDPGDIHKTLANAVEARPQAWLLGVTQYVTQQGYGKAHGLKGLDGLVTFYEKMREIQRNMLKTWSGPRLVIENAGQDWEASYQKVDAFLLNVYKE